MDEGSLSLHSTAFKEGELIPPQYGCKGQNINPPLNISGVPQNAKSLTLIMHDPDAVSGDYVHWLMWDIPPAVGSIAANSVPVGALQGVNSAGGNRYTGPCPPAGTSRHRYMFELYALDKNLGLDPSHDRQKLQSAIKGHILAKTMLIGIVEAS